MIYNFGYGIIYKEFLLYHYYEINVVSEYALIASYIPEGMDMLFIGYSDCYQKRGVNIEHLIKVEWGAGGS